MSDRSQNSPNKIHWKKQFIDDPKRRHREKDHSSHSFQRKHSFSSKSSSKSVKRRKMSKRHSVSISRSDSNSPNKSQKTSSVKKGPSLSYMLFVDKKYLTYFVGNNENYLRNLEKSIGDTKIHFDYDYSIPEMNGAVLIVDSDDCLKKKDSIKIILESILEMRNKEPENEKTRELKCLILVPNGLVSIIIGTKGKQISTLIKESGCNIVVNQPIFKMLHRTITITGKTYNIANAILNIYKIMEERFYEVKNAEMECKPLDIRTTKTSAKFIFSHGCVNYLMGKRGTFISKLDDLFRVTLKFYEDKKNRTLGRNEQIAVKYNNKLQYLKGTVQDVQDAICLLIKKILHYYKDDHRSKDPFTLKMLIPKIFVTKLIGAKGCMIQEISNTAGGANIKILSDKKLERELDLPEIIVSIGGNLGQMQDAACIIVEQIECFKNGGPVLASGKSIHQNIAQQFKNSVVIADQEKGKEAEGEKFINNKRSRSQSRSKSVQSIKRIKIEEKNENNDQNIDKNNAVQNNNENSLSKTETSILKSDPSKNISFEEKGVMKISCDIVVPDYLVSVLIGRNSETIKSIMSKSGTTISFQKEDDLKIKTSDGILGRICNIKGTATQAAQALQYIADTIIRVETNLNGVKKEYS